MWRDIMAKFIDLHSLPYNAGISARMVGIA